MQPTVARTRPEPLGAAATILSSTFALVVGLVVGMITTFTHAQYLPWGLVIGLLVVLALVTGFRLVFDSRIVGAAAGVGVVGALGILSLPGASGPALVVDNVAGWIWAIGPVVLVTIALAWPRPRLREASADAE